MKLACSHSSLIVVSIDCVMCSMFVLFVTCLAEMLVDPVNSLVMYRWWAIIYAICLCNFNAAFSDSIALIGYPPKFSSYLRMPRHYARSWIQCRLYGVRIRSGHIIILGISSDGFSFQDNWYIRSAGIAIPTDPLNASLATWDNPSCWKSQTYFKKPF